MKLSLISLSYSDLSLLRFLWRGDSQPWLFLGALKSIKVVSLKSLILLICSGTMLGALDITISCSATQLYLTLCNPVDCVQHTRLLCPSLPPRVCLNSCPLCWSNHLILCHPFFLLPSIFPSIRIFCNESALWIRGQSIGASASASVIPVNIQGWFPLGLTGLICLLSKGLSRIFSRTSLVVQWLKNLPANAGDIGLIPSLGRSHMPEHHSYRSLSV